MDRLIQYHLKAALSRNASHGELASFCRAADAYIRATYPSARPAVPVQCVKRAEVAAA